MKKILMVLVSVAAVAMAGSAMAATATVAVSANVTGTCRFITGGAISFTLDPSSTGPATGSLTQQPSFWCTKGASYTITDAGGVNDAGPGQHRMINGASEYIPYTLSLGAEASGTGQGKGTTLYLTTLSGTVANADFINASAGSYSDTVTISITP